MSGENGEWVEHDLSKFISGFDDYRPGDGPSTAAYTDGFLHMVNPQPSSGTWSMVIPTIILPATGLVTLEVTDAYAPESRDWAAYVSKAVPPGLNDWGSELMSWNRFGGSIQEKVIDTASFNDAYPHVVWNLGPGARIGRIRTIGIIVPDEPPPSTEVGVLRTKVSMAGPTVTESWQNWGLANATPGAGKIRVASGWHVADDDAAAVTGALKVKADDGTWKHASWMTDA